MTMSRSETFAAPQLILAVETSPTNVVLIHGDDAKHWRERWFISPVEAAKIAVVLSEMTILSVERKPGLVKVKPGHG